MAAPKLGELLIKDGLLKPDQLERVLEEQKKTGQKLGVVIINLGLLKEAQINKILEKHFQVPGIDLNQWETPEEALKLIPKEMCEKHCVVPVSKQGNTLVVAFSDPGNIFVKDDLSFVSRCKIQPVVAPESAIINSIEKYYGKKVATASQDLAVATAGVANGNQIAIEIIDDDSVGEDAPIIKYVNMILAEAVQRKASDIHFEPYEKKFRVRLRVDGSLREVSEPPLNSSMAILSRLKIMSRLDISERRKPQDGRIKVKTVKGKEIDFRVSSVPTLWGEKIVLRLLDKSNLQLDMTKLGFEIDDLKVFKDAINMPQGLVLITGPTGSGKTTTIYSALYELNKIDVNISTAEDPVEFNLEGINQVQMNPEIGLTFANSLRAFLRQDPDIVMVGEIRDLETAEVAFKAASTGHMVVSTLHTNDAPATVIRLTEMGVAPYLVTSTVSLIVAQRLVGKNCDSCKTPISVKPEVLINLGVNPADVGTYNLMKGRGCVKCEGSGIKGRLAIYELMSMSEGIKEAILNEVSTGELRVIARKDGTKTLRRAALLKLKSGETTIEEVVNASVRDT
jgi:type IV pilus assembly protein PilB